MDAIIEADWTLKREFDMKNRSLCSLYRSAGLVSFVLLTGPQGVAWGEDTPPCAAQPLVEVARTDVYKGMPFKAGEVSKFSLEYGAVHVGYGFLRIKNPIKEEVAVGITNGNPVRKSMWHMQFQGEAYTGDWYKAIFQGNDVIQAFSLPGSFAISQFYIRQNEKAALKSPVQIEKWLSFDQESCKVTEKVQNHSENKETIDVYNFEFGAADVLGAMHRLRSFVYEPGKPISFLVYSSQKSWWIEATSMGVESVKVEAGTFAADKLKLKTYIGKDMQATGDSYIWIARDHPSRPVVKVKAEVKIGSVGLYLDQFTPGN